MSIESDRILREVVEALKAVNAQVRALEKRLEMLEMPVQQRGPGRPRKVHIA